MIFTRKDKVRWLLVVAVSVGGVFVYKNYTATQGDTLPAIPQPIATDVPLIDPQSIGRVVKDADGKEFLSNQIIIEFAPETTEEEVLAIITKHEGAIVAHFTKAPVYLVQVKDVGDGSGAKKALALFQGEAQVKKAELNYLTVASPPTTTP